MNKSKSKQPVTSSVAGQLRKLIVESDQTVSAIARAAGIPQPVLYRFVTGERDLTLRTADKLFQHFQLELRPARKRRRE